MVLSPIVLALLLLTVLSKNILYPENITLATSYGERDNRTLPRLFKTYQHADLGLMLSQSSETFRSCSIKVVQKSGFNTSLMIPYDETKKFDKWIKTITNFGDLLLFKYFLDAIMTPEGEVVIAFQDRMTFGFRKSKDGSPETWKGEIMDLQPLDAGNFVIVKGVVILVTDKNVYRMRADHTFIKVTGYTALGQGTFSVAKASNLGIITIAAGSAGVYMYEFEPNDNSLKLIGDFLPFFMDQQQTKVLVRADDIEYDEDTKEMFLVDEETGLHVMSFLKDRNLIETTLQIERTLFYAVRCADLYMTKFALYLSCPQLVKISRETQKMERMPEVDFKPRQFVFNDSRIFLFSRSAYIIFDALGKKVEQGNTYRKYEKLLVLEDTVIGFTHDGFYFNKIEAQKEEIVCYGPEAGPFGTITGFVQLTGLCSQLEKQEKKTSDLECKVNIPVALSVSGPSQVSRIIEFILLGVLVWSLIVGVIWILVRNAKVKKEYESLTEESHLDSKRQKSQVEVEVEIE